MNGFSAFAAPRYETHSTSSLHFPTLSRTPARRHAHPSNIFFYPRSFPFTRLGFHETALKTRNKANLSKNIKIWNATAMNKKFLSLAKREKDYSRAWWKGIYLELHIFTFDMEFSCVRFEGKFWCSASQQVLSIESIELDVLEISIFSSTTQKVPLNPN